MKQKNKNTIIVIKMRWHLAVSEVVCFCYSGVCVSVLCLCVSIMRLSLVDWSCSELETLEVVDECAVV